MATEIKASVEPINLLKNIESTFSGTTTFIGELLQNSRRAGATRIDVRIKHASNGRCVATFSDDGKGAASFSDFLTLGKIGWDSAVVEADNPFGMGFFSVIFACDKVSIESGHRRLVCTKEDVLAMRPLKEDSLDKYVHGTRIKMTGGAKFVQALGEDFTTGVNIEHFAKGFPLPVTLNGKLLDSDYSESRLSEDLLYESELGRVYLTPCGGMERHAYFQGLPIRLPLSFNESMVVHLNPKQFSVRMPDRENLLDTKDCRDKILAIRDASLKALITKNLEVENWVWLWDHYQWVLACDMLEIYNQCDYIPADVMVDATSDTFLDGTAFLAEEWNVDISGECEPVTCATLGERPVVVSDPSLHYDFTWRQYAGAAKVFLLDAQLDDGHWALANVRSSVGITSVEPIDASDKRVLINADFSECFLYECSHFVLKGGLGEFVYQDNAMFRHCDLYIPKSKRSIEPSSLQDYYDEWGNLMHSRRDAAEMALDAAITALRSTPADALLSVLIEAVDRYGALGLDGNYQLTIKGTEVSIKAA